MSDLQGGQPSGQSEPKQPIDPTISVATAPEEAAMVPFSWAQQWQFITKELRETLRDRRTIVTLLAMPILLYPLLGLGFRFVAIQESTAKKPFYVIAVNTTEADGRWLDRELEFGEAALARAAARRAQRQQEERALNSGGNKDSASSNGDPATNKSASTDEELETSTGVEFAFRWFPDRPAADLKQLVSDGAVDLAMTLRFQSDLVGDAKFDGPVTVELIEDHNRMPSRNAADWFSDRFTAANRARFAQLGRAVNPEFRLPVDHFRSVVTQTGKSTLVGLLPLILLLMTVTGGVYPAIDLTAGERERNTLETLMSIPVPKFRLLLAKFVAVFLVTLLTGLMNLTFMSLTLYALQLDKVLLGPAGFSFGLAAKLLLALSAFGLFYSAVLLMLTSSARSFKEAQSYLIPLLLLSIGPGLVIFLPGWELTPITAVTPLINILLLSKQFLEGTAAPLPAVAAILSTVLYGLAALGLASRVFGADAVAVGSRGKLVDLLHASDEAHRTPSTAISLVGLAFLFPAYFIVSGILGRQETIPISWRLLISAAMTIVLFLLVPLLLLRLEKVPVRSGLTLLRPRVVYILGAILLGCSTWPWIFEVIVGLQELGLHGLDTSKFAVVEKMLESWKQLPLALIILCLGVTPGVCEEVFFRGFLYNGLKQSLRARTTIIATAIAFGLFHVVLSGGAAPERVLPSTLMGLLLGWVRWRSGSLIPGIILHATHNSALLAMASYRDELNGWGLGGVKHESHLPMTWLGIAAVGFILGAALVYLDRRRRAAATVAVSTV